MGINMKHKILSFCMAVVMTLSVALTQNVFAAGNEQNLVQDSADTKVVGLLEALGLMEIDSETGFFWDNMPVKRSELARVLCGMFELEENANENPVFNDVGDSDRPYVETAVRNGYMSGYDNAKFGPDDYVTNMQLIKIFVTALGGEALAQAQGGYPSGYITIGNMLGLLNGKVGANDNITSRIDVANIIYMALHADIVRVDGSVGNNINYKTTKGETFLTEKRNIYRVKGIVSKNEATSLNRDNAGAGEKSVQIGDYVYGDSKYLAMDYLGCDVEAYIQIPDGELGDVVYIHENKNNKIVELTDENIISVSGDTVRYYDENDKTKSLRVSATYDMLYNGKAVDHRTGEKLERLEKLDTADIKFIDNDGNGAYDVVLVTEYIGRIVYSVNVDEEKILFNYNEQNLELANNYYIIYKNGNQAELAELEKGDSILMAVSENTEGEKVIRIEASSESIQGSVSSIRQENSGKKKTYAKISNKEYMLSTYCRELEVKNKIDEIVPNASGRYYIDARGNIAYVEESVSGEIVAFLIDYAIYMEDGYDSLSIKVWDENQNLKKMTAVKEVKIDGKKVKIEKLYDNTELNTKLDTPQLIKYTENDKGELTGIIFAEEGYNPQKFSLDAKATMTCNHNGVLAEKYALESDAKIFYVPNTTKDNADYDKIMNERGLLWVLGKGFISYKTNYDVSLYDVKENGRVKYVLIRYGYGWRGNLMGSGHSMAVVNDVIEYEDDGMLNYQLSVMTETGKESVYKLADSEVLNAKVAKLKGDGTQTYDKSENRPVQNGDVIQVHWDSRGRVDDIWIQHSADDTEYFEPVTIGMDSNDYYYRCIFGKAMYTSPESIIVSGKPDEYDGPTSDGIKFIENSGNAVYRCSRVNKVFTKISFEDVSRGSDVFTYVNPQNKTNILVVYE